MNAATELNPWWDWLLCDSRTLKRRGYDPQERLAKTGHERALSPQWARSIGMWARADPQSIIQRVFPRARDQDEKRKARTAYDLFKYRHKLIVKSGFMKRHMDNPDRSVFMQVGSVWVATLAHTAVYDHISCDRTGALSVGAAARQAVLYSLSETESECSVRLAAGHEREEKPFGILPIEALLYYYAIEYILDEAGISFDAWHKDTSGEGWLDRAEYWKNFDGDGIVTLPQIALDRYSPDDA